MFPIYRNNVYILRSIEYNLESHDEAADVDANNRELAAVESPEEEAM